VAHYHSVNLLDSPALAAVIDDVRRSHGRIDVLLHAGGIEISKPLDAKEPKEFNLVFDIKADGFFSLLKAAQGMPIGATVAFSSVAGRFGNSGQADYSAANDLLCKITSSMRAWRPATRAIVIDWTAWGGIGMATRGSIPKIMEMAGIDILPPEAGIPTIRRELTAGGTRGEIVVGQGLGILAEEFDPTGGLDTEKVARVLHERPALMLGQIKAAKLYGELDQHQQPDADLTVVVDGETLSVIVPELNNPDATGWLLIDGRPYEVMVDRNLHWIKSSRGFNRLELRDRETSAARPASADGRIKAPIPGQIARVLVAVSDTVEIGQSLMILEAMKMENHVRAPRAGKVDQLHVVAGQTVTLHALLAEIV
jgi:biotin carboxyl carrier protein